MTLVSQNICLAVAEYQTLLPAREDGFTGRIHMAEFPDFPSALPTLKLVLGNWAAKLGIPLKPGPAPKERPAYLLA